MIHATLLEQIPDDEREAMNLAILGRSVEPETPGPLRYARPGDVDVEAALRAKTVPVADAIAAIGARMPKGATL